MATFIALIDYTEQGVREIQQSPDRASAFSATARKHGVKVEKLYWTVGGHDGVAILDAPDDTAVAALLLSLASGGNVRTHTLRAYDRKEMQAILAKMT